MARAGVNYADILKAAEYIQHDGHLPTVDRVRAYLGTGSKSTIAPLLKQWREQNLTDTNAQGLPQDLLTAVKSLCDRVQHQADSKIEEEQKRCNSITDELQYQLTATLAELSQLKKAHATTARALVDAQTDHQSLTKKFDSAQHKHEKTAFQLAESVSRVAELKAVNAELKQECKDIRGHFEHYQARTAQDRQHERDQFQSTQCRDQAQLTSLTEQLREFTVQHAEHVTKHGQLEKKCDQLRDDNQSLSQRLAAKSTAYTTLQQDIVAKEQKNAALKQEIETLQDQRDALTHQCVEADKTRGLLTQSHEGISAELEKIKITHHNLQREYQLALQEKAQLQGQYKQLAMSLP